MLDIFAGANEIVSLMRELLVLSKESLEEIKALRKLLEETLEEIDKDV